MVHPNALGQPISLPLGNSLVTQYRYYALDQAPPQPNQWYGRLSSLVTGGVQSQTMTSYDLVGNPTGISYGDHTAEAFAAGYDEWDQLTSYGSLEGYSYLPAGQSWNIGTLQTKGADAYTYPQPGQPMPHAPSAIPAAGQSYSYDQNGNRDNNGLYYYSYDAENHLTELNNDGLPEIQNAYDGDGARLVRTLTNGATQYIGNWYEADPATGVGTAYYPFHGVPVAMKQGGTLSYLHHDHLGSLVSATDASGAELGWARYLPFGGLRLSGGALPTDRLFTGQTRDFGDQFYYFKARYYDAGIGQFQSPDLALPKYDQGPRDRRPPQGPADPQTLNRYSYALNNPLRFVDPSGQAAYDIFVGGVGGLDPSYSDFAQKLHALTGDTVLLFNVYGNLTTGFFGHIPGAGLGADTILALIRGSTLNAALRTVDLPADSAAGRLSAFVRALQIGTGDQLNLIGFSGGAAVALNASALLQRSGFQHPINHLITIGGYESGFKSSNVQSWTAIIGSRDFIATPTPQSMQQDAPVEALRTIGWGQIALPDQTIVLPGIGHVTWPDFNPGYFVGPVEATTLVDVADITGSS